MRENMQFAIVIIAVTIIAVALCGDEIAVIIRAFRGRK